MCILLLRDIPIPIYNGTTSFQGYFSGQPNKHHSWDLREVNERTKPYFELHAIKLGQFKK